MAGILYYLIFPGLLFLFVSGLIASWLERKITARLQWRVGPVFLQPYYDIRKLMFKEVIVPAGGNQWLFTVAPVLSVFVVILISNLLIVTWLYPGQSFFGDIIVLIYLMTIPSLLGILGASASNNAFASLGASREIKSILGYEFPFILSIIVAIVQSKSILLGTIIAQQQAGGSMVWTFSGALAAIVMLFCIQAKLGIIPFDMAEAESELAGGCHIEYSGPLLALWKIAKMMMLVLGPLFIVAVFWSGGNGWLIPFKYLFIFLIMVLIRNTNPRVRIDQSIRFFWKTVNLAAVVAVILSVLGY
jgi:NADH-quinone oxidoreductase subunit H